MHSPRIHIALTTGLAALALPLPPADAAAIVLPTPTSLAQAVSEGRWVFVNDSFGTRRQWIPEDAFDGRPMTCAACHGSGLAPSRTPGGFALPSLVGVAARYPALRGGQVVTLTVQVQRCIARGIGGVVPDETSPEMVSLVTYLTALSRGRSITTGLPSP